MDHLIDGAMLAMVVDRESHPCLPFVIPKWRLTREQHEGGIMHIGVMEEAKCNWNHAFALEVIDVFQVH